MRLCDLPDSSMTLPSPLVETAARGPGGTRMDMVPEEVPVALSFNGISHAVMLASPTDLEDFALGFSLSEGILADPGELYDLELEIETRGVVVQMHIAEARFVELKNRRRALAGRTGCGLCGVESLDQVARTLAPLPAGPAVAAPVERQEQRGAAGEPRRHGHRHRVDERQVLDLEAGRPECRRRRCAHRVGPRPGTRSPGEQRCGQPARPRPVLGAQEGVP